MRKTKMALEGHVTEEVSFYFYLILIKKIKRILVFVIGKVLSMFRTTWECVYVFNGKAIEI